MELSTKDLGKVTALEDEGLYTLWVGTIRQLKLQKDLYFKLLDPIPCDVRNCGKPAYLVNFYPNPEKIGLYAKHAQCKDCTIKMAKNYELFEKE